MMAKMMLKMLERNWILVVRTKKFIRRFNHEQIKK